MFFTILLCYAARILPENTWIRRAQYEYVLIKTRRICDMRKISRIRGEVTMKRKAILTAVITLSLIASSLMPVFAANRNMDILDAETTLIDTTTLPVAAEEIEQRDNGSMVSHSYEFTEEQKAQIDQEVQDYLSKTSKPNLKTIIGVDEREKVEIPDSRIALIIPKFPDKGFSRGTAFLISGGEYFATAAHCLYDKETAQNPE